MIADHDAPLVLDQSKLDEAKHSLDDGAVTPGYGPWREDIITLLNGALATEIVCTMRYKRHYYTAKGVDSSKVAEEFLVHADEEWAHAGKLAERIVQLGGLPEWNPSELMKHSHADYSDTTDLHEMIKSNLIAERVAIEAYTQMIRLIGDRDPTTRKLLVDILEQEEEHADELNDWMDAKGM